jgi:hypothetical protein
MRDPHVVALLDTMADAFGPPERRSWVRRGRSLESSPEGSRFFGSAATRDGYRLAREVDARAWRRTRRLLLLWAVTLPSQVLVGLILAYVVLCLVGR